MKFSHKAVVFFAGLGLSAPALASVYGSVDFGKAKAHNTLPYVINDTSNLSTGYGDGETYGLNLGLRTSSPLFVELAFNRTVVDSNAATGAIVPGGGSCDISPLLGLINDCWDRGEIDLEVERENIEVLGGYTFKVASLDVSPYAGVRRQTTTDSRRVRYLYDGGVSNFITQETEFKGTGLVLGARVQQDIGSLFWGADAQVALMDGERTMSIDDKEIDTPGGSLSAQMTAFLSDSQDSTQYALKVYGGMKFEVAGQSASVSLGYAYQEATNVLVTSNTNDDSFLPGAIGDSSADLRTDMIYLSLGIALK